MPYAKKGKGKKMKKQYKRKTAVPRGLGAKGQDMIVRKFTTAYAMAPVQGVTVTNYLKLFFSPWNATSNSLIRDNTEFRLWANLYDRYRISQVKVRVIPRVDSINQQTVTAHGQQEANDSAGVYYVVYDRDSIAPSNITALNRYRSKKCIKQTKGFTGVYNCRWPNRFWLDTTADINPGTASPGYQTSMEIGAQGGITIYGENFTERSGQVLNFKWADIEVTFTIAFQNYNPSRLTIGEEGQVTVDAPTDLDDVTKPMTSLTLADGMTGATPVDE